MASHNIEPFFHEVATLQMDANRHFFLETTLDDLADQIYFYDRVADLFEQFTFPRSSDVLTRPLRHSGRDQARSGAVKASHYWLWHFASCLVHSIHLRGV